MDVAKAWGGVVDDVEASLRGMVEQVKQSNTTVVRGDLGGKQTRFTVARSELLPNPILVAERLESKGNRSTWLSVPMQGYTRQRQAGLSVAAGMEKLPQEEAELIQDLLGTWTPASTFVADAVAAMDVTWTPRAITFELGQEGDLRVRAEGEGESPEFANFKSENVTVERFISDRANEAISRLKLDDVENFAEELKDARTPGGALDTAVNTARSIAKSGGGQQDGKDGYAEGEAAKAADGASVDDKPADDMDVAKAWGGVVDDVEASLRGMVEQVKQSNTTVVRGDLGGKQTRFTVARSELLPNPILVAERLESKGNRSTWLSVPMQGYTRQRQAGLSVAAGMEKLPQEEAELIQDLLGTWTPASTLMADALAAMDATWTPRAITFKLGQEGDLLVRAEGEGESPEFANFKSENVTVERYIGDRANEAISRLKLDDVKNFAEELKDARTPGEALDAVVNTARSIAKGDGDQQDEESMQDAPTVETRDSNTADAEVDQTDRKEGEGGDGTKQ